MRRGPDRRDVDHVDHEARVLALPHSRAHLAIDADVRILAHAAREFADAIKEYRHVLELAPDDTGTRFMLGFTYVDMQDWPSAITTLKEVIYRDPAHSAAYGFLQYALSENGNIAEAEAIREQAAKLTSAGKPVGTRTSGPQT